MCAACKGSQWFFSVSFFVGSAGVNIISLPLNPTFIIKTIKRVTPLSAYEKKLEYLPCCQEDNYALYYHLVSVEQRLFVKIKIKG